jgi:Uma2 family endonuclease
MSAIDDVPLRERTSVWMNETEYFALLKASDRKWEFYPEQRMKPSADGQIWGEVVAMAGGSKEHNRVGANLVGNLFDKLRDTGCLVNTSDTAVGAASENGYRFPDASTVCGKPEYREHAGIEILLNPTAIFEVTSESSDGRDRTEKVSRYTSMPSVQLYVILKQDKPEADLLIRTSHNEWAMRNLKGLDASIEVDPPGITLTLAELYENVELA